MSWQLEITKGLTDELMDFWERLPKSKETLSVASANLCVWAGTTQNFTLIGTKAPQVLLLNYSQTVCSGKVQQHNT